MSSTELKLDKDDHTTKGWTETGTLVIHSTERICQFCEPKKQKAYRYTHYLKCHVHNVHINPTRQAATHPNVTIQGFDGDKVVRKRVATRINTAKKKRVRFAKVRKVLGEGRTNQKIPSAPHTSQIKKVLKSALKPVSSLRHRLGESNITTDMSYEQLELELEMIELRHRKILLIREMKKRGFVR